MATQRPVVGGLVPTDTVTPKKITSIPEKTPRFPDGRPDWLKQCTQLCKGACCKYIGVPLTPCTTARDWDDWRWFLAHEGISIYKDAGTWYLNVETRCGYLTPDLKCGIYETRPATCAEYDPSACEWQDPDGVWQIHLTSPEDLEAFLRKKKAQRAAAARKRQARTGGAAKKAAPSKPKPKKTKKKSPPKKRARR